MAAQCLVLLLLWFFQINQYMRDSLSPGTASPPSHGVSHLGGCGRLAPPWGKWPWPLSSLLSFT